MVTNMKTKIAAFILILLCCVNARAQEDESFFPENNYHPSFVGCRITPDKIMFYPQNPMEVVSFVYKSKHTSGALFNNAKQWVAKTFNNYKDVVQMEDANSHTIVFKGSLRQKLYKTSVQSIYTILYYTATIECKERKFRIKMEDFYVKENSYIRIGSSESNTSRNLTFRDIHELIKDTSFGNEFKKFLNHIIEDAKENTALLFNSLSSAIDTVDDF